MDDNDELQEMAAHYEARIAKLALHINKLEKALRAIREGDKHDKARVLFVNEALGKE